MLKKENLEQLIQKLEAQHTKLRIFNEAYENNKNRICLLYTSDAADE